MFVAAAFLLVAQTAAPLAAAPSAPVIDGSAQASVTVLRAARIDVNEVERFCGDDRQVARDQAGTLWIEFR